MISRATFTILNEKILIYKIKWKNHFNFTETFFTKLMVCGNILVSLANEIKSNLADA
jgi:hypothetical protein